MSYINDDVTQPIRSFSLFQGPLSETKATGFGFPSAPSCAVIALGLNDCSDLYGPDLVGNAIGSLINACRRAVQDCSIVVIAHSNPDGITSDVTAANGLLTNARSWPLYVDRMASIARENTCAFLNIDAKWGPRGLALGFQNDNVHPSQRGHDDIAQLLGVL